MTCICTDNTCFPTIPMPCCEGTPGVAGPAGPAGTTMLFNDMTTSTVTSTGSIVPFINAKRFLIPNTLLSVGDKIRVTSIFEIQHSGSPVVRIYNTMDGQICNAVECFLGSGPFIKMVSEISCKAPSASANNIWVDDVNYINPKNQLPYAQPCTSVETFSGQNLTVVYGTAPGVYIACEGYIDIPPINIGPPSIKCYQLSVEYIKA